ncbi:MAG: VCBS repeat-containing protein [Planctomycetes bacterium]|nr:VCBS repeat-containing protein [Planctomycetota bacterium]
MARAVHCRWTVLLASAMLCLTVPVQGERAFKRGDCDSSGWVDTGDAFVMLFRLFLVQGVAHPCEDACDANDDGVVDIADSSYLVNWLYVPGTPAPPLPGVVSCWLDPTPDGLGCENYPPEECGPIPAPAGRLFESSRLDSGGDAPAPIALDIDNDGRLDLVDDGRLFFGTASGGFFWVDPSVDLGGGTDGVAGDFDGDGRPDIVVLDRDPPYLRVFPHRTGRDFGSILEPAVSDGGDALAVADFDLDGSLDLAIARAESDSATILLGQGNGDFVELPAFSIAGAPNAIEVADFDRDGVIDLAFGCSATDSVVFRFGDGAGRFPGVTVVTTADLAERANLALGDLDRDGAVDIVTSGVPGWIRSFGDGTFASWAPLVVGADPVEDVSVVDGNGDGLPDVVAVGGLGSQFVFDNLGGSFAAARTTLIGRHPRRLWAGDLDGDSCPDVVTRCAEAGTSLRFGDCQGGFDSARTFNAGIDLRDVLSADVDDDGDADVLILDAAIETVTPWENDGTGALSPLAPLPTVPSPRSMAQFDVDGDGWRDLVVVGEVSNGLWIHPGLVGGGFSTLATTVVTPPLIDIIASGVDLDLDGDPDLVARQELDRIRVFANDGTGVLQSIWATPISALTRCAVSDVNLDGIPDLVLTTGLYHSIRLGNGDGTFALGTDGLNPGLPTLSSDIVFADMDQDGTLDLVSGNSAAPGIAILLGDGSGGLSTGPGLVRLPTPYPGAARLVSTVVDDLDGDGVPDLATVTTAGALHYLRGTGSADLLPAGSFDVVWGARAVCWTDLDLDGRMDVVVVGELGEVSISRQRPGP